MGWWWAGSLHRLEEVQSERVGMLESRTMLSLAVGLVIGVLGFGLVRLVSMPPLDSIHYHANWALWVDGKRVDLTGDQYMEDAAACSSETSNITAPQRVHLHNNNPDVVHIHHGGSTWGHLLQNLGWGIGSDWLFTDKGELYGEDAGRRLTFVLNGFFVPPASNRVIQAGDRMLISFGVEDPDVLIGDQFPSIGANAPEFDSGFDPAGCQGNTAETLEERIRRAFWF